MKITFENQYNCSVVFVNENNRAYHAPCSFDTLEAALAYCEEEIDVRQQAITAYISDTATGEVIVYCDWDEDSVPEEDYPIWESDF